MNINAVRGLFIVLEEEKEQLIKEIEEEGADFINKILKIIIGIITVSVIFFIINTNKSNNGEIINNHSENENIVEIAEKNNSEVENTIETNSEVKSEKIEIIDIDGKGKNYSFSYNDETYTATYTKENWHINNSYKIKKEEDIRKICQALIEVHQIHGKDMVSYRTAEDMAYEWIQHNIAYEMLPEDSPWKEHAKHVDLNPEDQGKSLKELYKSRTLN